MIPGLRAGPPGMTSFEEADWHRDSLLRQVDSCKSTDDRAYLLETLASYPAFAIALDELVAAGVLTIKTRRRRCRDPRGFAVGEPWTSEPALYRVPRRVSQ